MRINATVCLVILIVHITVAQHPPRQPPGPAPVAVHTQGQPQPIRGSGLGQKVGPQASNQAPPASVGHPPKNPGAGHHTASQNSNRNTNIQPHPVQQPTGQKPVQQDPKALSREVHKLVQESVKAHPHPHSNHNNPPGQPLAGNSHSGPNKPPIHRVTTPTTRKPVAAAATPKTTLRTTPKATTTKTTPRVTPKITPRVTTTRTTPKATTTKTTPKATTTRTTPKATTTRTTPKATTTRITPKATTTRTTPKATTTRTTPKATTTRTTQKATTTKTTPKTTTKTTPKTTTRTSSTTAVPSPSSTLKLGPLKIVNFKPNTRSESEAPPPPPPQSIIRGPPRENIFVPYNPTKHPQQPSVNQAEFTDPVQNLPIRTPESTPQHHQSVVDFIVPEQPVAKTPVVVPLLPYVQEAELERHQMPVDTFDNNGPVLESRNQEEQFGNANLNEGGWVPSQDASTYNQAQEQLAYEPNSHSQPVIQPDYNMPEGNEKGIGTLDQDGYIQEQPYYNTFTQAPLTDYNSVYNDKENEPHLPHLPPYKFRKENLNEPTWARNSILHDRFLNQNNLDYDARDDYEDQSNSSGVAQPSVSVHLFVCILTIHSVFLITNKNIFLQYCN